MSNEWFFRQGALEQGPWESVVDQTISGWKYAGLRIGTVNNDALQLQSRDVERMVVPLSGSFSISFMLDGERNETTQSLQGRASVFSGPTDVLYLPAKTSASITGVGKVAVAEAPSLLSRSSAYISADNVPVELRGAGRSSRQVHNFGTPDSLDADRLIVCEVITPSENWSSYPPHKHDEYIPGQESQLEEIYYFESAVTRGASAPPAASPFGYMRNYASSTGFVDTLAEVRSGDIALVPSGWHGPCVAAPGYDLYYLNVMAGPGPERVWQIRDDPSHAWVRDSWSGQVLDPRLPYSHEVKPEF